MDFKNIKEKLNKKVHPAWLWVLSIIMGLFSFMSFNILFEPSFIPAPIIDISKKIVGTILGDQDVDVVTNNDDIQNNVVKNNSDQSNNVDISDWKIYENKELGFSIKYPKELNKQEVKNTPRIAFTEEFLLEDTDQMAPIELMVLEQTLEVTVEQRINTLKQQSLKNYSETEIIIDGIKARKLSGRFSVFYWGEVNFTYIVYENNSKIFEWSAYTEDESINNTFELMISNLKFIK